MPPGIAEIVENKMQKGRGVQPATRNNRSIENDVGSVCTTGNSGNSGNIHGGLTMAVASGVNLEYPCFPQAQASKCFTCPGDGSEASGGWP